MTLTHSIEFEPGATIDGSGRRYPDHMVARGSDGSLIRERITFDRDESEDSDTDRKAAYRRAHGRLLDALTEGRS